MSASIPKDSSRVSLPGIKAADARSESEKPSSIPLPTSRQPSSTPVVTSTRPPPVGARPKSTLQPLHRFLSPVEWAKVAHAVGAIKEGEETHKVAHPTCWYWPPKGLPDGLYRDVVTQRSKYFYYYHILSTIRWILMLLQIILGAVLTALGSVEMKSGTPITILAVINTVDAGMLALLHNSGLPDRYRLDKAEFIKVEDFLKELLETGIADNQTVDNIIADCFGMFQKAKATVLANMPESYTTGKSAPMSSFNPGEKQHMPCPDHSVHFYPSEKIAAA